MIFVCEFCNKQFHISEDCARCEKSHNPLMTQKKLRGEEKFYVLLNVFAVCFLILFLVGSLLFLDFMRF